MKHQDTSDCHNAWASVNTKLTIKFFDSVLDGTISDEGLARYAPALKGNSCPSGSRPAPCSV